LVLMAALDGTIDIFGQHVKKKTAAIAGLGIGGLAGIFWWRNRQSAAAAAATTSSDTSSTAGTIDPETGDVAGSPQDEIDLAALQQEQSADEVDSASEITGDGNIIGYDDEGNPIYGAGGTTPTPVTTTGYTTNAQWGTAAEAALGSNGTDAIAAAIAKYLNGQPITTDQATTVQEAQALVGSPPVAGTNGNPPGYVTTGGTSPSPVSGSKPAKAPTGTRSTPGATSAVVAWAGVTGATQYRVRAWEGGKTVVVIFDNTTSSTSATIPALKSKTKYGWHVAAANAAGLGPYSANATFTTT
jgi:Fibronectin type III domain